MTSKEPSLMQKKVTNFTQSLINVSRRVGAAANLHSTEDPDSNTFGGIIQNGQLSWLAHGPVIEIFSNQTGQKVSNFHFDTYLSYRRCIITCVEEVNTLDFGCCILAIGIQFGDAAGGAVAVFSVHGSVMLRCIEIQDKITSCRFLNPELVDMTSLYFNGCLAYGTDSGKIFLIDLCLDHCRDVLFLNREQASDAILIQSQIVPSNTNFQQLFDRYNYKEKGENNFGIQLEVIEEPAVVLSILDITPSLTLVVGLENGIMVLYDISNLQAFHLAHPPEPFSPLVKLDYMEPADDPQACIYIWAFHENPKNAFAVMHSVKYNRKIEKANEFVLYAGFQCCSMRLTLPIFERHSLPIACQSVTKLPTDDDEEIISLCLLSWKAPDRAEVMLFDVNQWYKAQMPSRGDWRDDPSYLASFSLKDSSPLDVWIDPNSIAQFNSFLRPDEHFYPNSLTFDIIVVQQKAALHLHWPGLQNYALQKLCAGGPNALIDPKDYFDELRRASLITSDRLSSSNAAQQSFEREALLTAALENNCIRLLNDCATAWADGSHLGRQPFEGLSLSTITQWIWKMAQTIKQDCNIECVSLFDHSGLRIDERTKKKLFRFSKQLFLLTDLLKIILTTFKQHIPDEIYKNLDKEYLSVRIAAEYQEVLQWLLHMGLLPEGDTNNSSSLNSRNPIVPFPYKEMKKHYTSRRLKFYRLSSSLLSPRTQSCRILYIDSFIEHECGSDALRNQWVESGGNGLYPPPSLQALLRILLLPNIHLKSKHSILMYLFLDLHAFIGDERYDPIIRNLGKFPAVFKIDQALVKTIQGFWNLDHGNFDDAVDEIVSPVGPGRSLSQWQQELLIEALLAQDQPELALRALKSHSASVSSLLELKTLVANDLVAEAFHLQRSKNDIDLFRAFLVGCGYLGKWNILLGLTYNESEENLLKEFLRTTTLNGAANINFVYLVQRSKYIEAITYLAELAKNKPQNSNPDLDTPSLMLTAFGITMSPERRRLSEVYLNIRNRLKIKPKQENRSPLGGQLLTQNGNEIPEGIFHTAVLCTDAASLYSDDQLRENPDRLQNPINVPFLRSPLGNLCFQPEQKDILCYPETYQPTEKKRLRIDDDESDVVEMPNKRRKISDSISSAMSRKRTISAINSSLLTKFSAKSAFPVGTSSAKTKKSVRSSVLGHKPVPVNSELLPTPFVESKTLDTSNESSTESSDLDTLSVNSPHRILKRRPFSSSIASDSSVVRDITFRTDDYSIEQDFDGGEKLMRSNLFGISSAEQNHPKLQQMESEISVKLDNPLKSYDSKTSSYTKPDNWYSTDATTLTLTVDENCIDIDSQKKEDSYSKKYGRVESVQGAGEVEEKSPKKSYTASTSESPSTRRIYLSDRPKARQPLKRSRITPDSESKFENSESGGGRTSSDRSRSNTPSQSSLIKTEYMELKSKTESTGLSRKPLSRLVLETNVLKQTSELDPKTPLSSSGLGLAMSSAYNYNKISGSNQSFRGNFSSAESARPDDSETISMKKIQTTVSSTPSSDSTPAKSVHSSTNMEQSFANQIESSLVGEPRIGDISIIDSTSYSLDNEFAVTSETNAPISENDSYVSEPLKRWTDLMPSLSSVTTASLSTSIKNSDESTDDENIAENLRKHQKSAKMHSLSSWSDGEIGGTPKESVAQSSDEETPESPRRNEHIGALKSTMRESVSSENQSDEEFNGGSDTPTTEDSYSSKAAESESSEYESEVEIGHTIYTSYYQESESSKTQSRAYSPINEITPNKIDYIKRMLIEKNDNDDIIEISSHSNKSIDSLSSSVEETRKRNERWRKLTDETSGISLLDAPTQSAYQEATEMSLITTEAKDDRSIDIQEEREYANADGNFLNEARILIDQICDSEENVVEETPEFQGEIWVDLGAGRLEQTDMANLTETEDLSTEVKNSTTSSADKCTPVPRRLSQETERHQNNAMFEKNNASGSSDTSAAVRIPFQHVQNIIENLVIIAPEISHTLDIQTPPRTPEGTVVQTPPASPLRLMLPDQQASNIEYLNAQQIAQNCETSGLSASADIECCAQPGCQRSQSQRAITEQVSTVAETSKDEEVHTSPEKLRSLIREQPPALESEDKNAFMVTPQILNNDIPTTTVNVLSTDEKPQPSSPEQLAWPQAIKSQDFDGDALTLNFQETAKIAGNITTQNLRTIRTRSISRDSNNCDETADNSNLNLIKRRNLNKTRSSSESRDSPIAVSMRTKRSRRAQSAPGETVQVSSRSVVLRSDVRKSMSPMSIGVRTRSLSALVEDSEGEFASEANNSFKKAIPATPAKRFRRHSASESLSGKFTLRRNPRRPSTSKAIPNLTTVDEIAEETHKEDVATAVKHTENDTTLILPSDPKFKKSDNEKDEIKEEDNETECEVVSIVSKFSTNSTPYAHQTRIVTRASANKQLTELLLHPASAHAIEKFLSKGQQIVGIVSDQKPSNRKIESEDDDIDATSTPKSKRSTSHPKSQKKLNF